MALDQTSVSQHRLDVGPVEDLDLPAGIVADGERALRAQLGEVLDRVGRAPVRDLSEPALLGRVTDSGRVRVRHGVSLELPHPESEPEGNSLVN